MGKHIIAKTGTIAAVQKQLGYRQAAYAMQYARTTTEELAQVLDDRSARTCTTWRVVSAAPRTRSSSAGAYMVGEIGPQ